MDPFRLDSVAPVVAESFRQAPSNKRRQAAQVACEQAVEAADLTAPEVSEALAVLRGAVAPDASLRERLESLAARFDDEYFRLDEAGGQKQQALICFSKARATSALVFALAADDTQLHEAIYESISALDEPAELVRRVEHALG
jgi:hypothetical protein